MRLTIKNLQGKTICISEKNTILQSLGENAIDWMQACGAKGRCTTCKMVVLQGNEYLADYTEVEKKFVAQKRLLANERLACQVKPKNLQNDYEVIIQVPKTYQLPHILYND
ncbi:2Fe-2S iron-sulfur cluster-binding protein [Raineya orbicola]|jgi:2Fe-2S ferredoxin|uniref:Ferredoxin n=1 Tax=Raineya orbicola TaxID=2016530 RepID=A0A2N3IIK4_9BACT|nr:2Fe-2S iron-sulfur cluster-binding protein [Raineya orbicola]PKQ70180.1 Ferredoxin [Raineya orbicola]